VDTKTRELKSKVEEEIDNTPIGLDLSDLDEWAEETFSKSIKM
jgi:hypothetical protein